MAQAREPGATVSSSRSTASTRIDGTSGAFVGSVMISSTATTSTTAKPGQSPVSDDVARAVVQALLDTDLLGVALLRAGDWVHLMANAAYDALMSTEEPTTGRPFSDVV